MLSSMTGFGRAVLDAKLGKLTVEIQSVNRKYLEVFLSLPKEFSRFEPELRKLVHDAISRGQISLRVFFHPNFESLTNLLPDPKVLNQFKVKWEKIAYELGTNPEEIDLSFLLSHMPVLSQQDFASEEEGTFLKQGVQEAISQLVKMKKVEGKLLAQDLAERLQNLKEKIATIEKHSPDATQKMRQRLFEKMRETFQVGQEEQERLLKEVALFAERVDISEEITRFGAHMSQFKSLLAEEGVGRKMEFLVQEMGREINTIGSKSMEAKISHLVVDIKSELEKMREQIQNIE